MLFDFVINSKKQLFLMSFINGLNSILQLVFMQDISFINIRLYQNLYESDFADVLYIFILELNITLLSMIVGKRQTIIES